MKSNLLKTLSRTNSVLSRFKNNVESVRTHYFPSKQIPVSKTVIKSASFAPYNPGV